MRLLREPFMALYDCTISSLGVRNLQRPCYLF